MPAIKRRRMPSGAFAISHLPILRDLEAKLAGNLATGFLALGFTGEPVD